MIDMVRADFNEASDKLINDTEIIAWLNEGLKEVAKRGYFVKETGIDSAIGTTEYDLLAKVTDIIQPLDCRWTDATSPMFHARSWREYQGFVNGSWYATSDSPLIWYVQNNTMYVHPAPTTITVDGFMLLHTYSPAAIVCVTVGAYTEPPYPSAFDDTLVAWALYKCHLKRWAESDGTANAAFWLKRFNESASGMLGSAIKPRTRLRPYR